MNLKQLKDIFLKVLIGCLVAAAGLAVVTVLAGAFSEVFFKSFSTILIVALHALASFGFIDYTERQTEPESLGFFTTGTFVIIVLSFITAVFGTWGLIDWDLAGKLYMTYFVVLFAILHAEVLAKTTGKESRIDNTVFANYLFMALVVAMILPIIYIQDATTLGEFYFRGLAALGIIDATLTLVAILLHKIYLQKHPTVVSPVFAIPQATNQVPGQPGVQAPGQPGAPVQQVVVQQPRRMSALAMILLFIVGMQVIGSIFAMLMRFSR